MQYTIWSTEASICSLSAISNILMHKGIGLTDALSSKRHMNQCLCLRLLCFALQVLVKSHKHTRTNAHSCWDRCGNTGMCAHWVKSGRKLCACVSWLWGFYAGRFKVWSHMWRLKEQLEPLQSVWEYSGKGGRENKSREKIDRDHSHTLTCMHSHAHTQKHTHTKRNESPASVWKGFKRL